MGLDPELTRPFGQYSQGMRQRTSLARVLLSAPELLLLDEPFSNMDVESARQMVELLAGFRQSNRTIVLTTHQRELAAPIADWVLTLHAGRVASFEPGNANANEDQRRALSRIPRHSLRASRVRGRSRRSLRHHRRQKNRHARRAGLQNSADHRRSAHLYVFAVIPGDAELDFKKLARAAGLRKAEMAPLKEVQPLTGYIRGGVTVFGAKKAYPVFVDETIILFDKISVSAGTRGTQLILAPDDYLRAAEALTADLTKDKTTGAPPIRRTGVPTDRSSSVGWLSEWVGNHEPNDSNPEGSE